MTVKPLKNRMILFIEALDRSPIDSLVVVTESWVISKIETKLCHKLIKTSWYLFCAWILELPYLFQVSVDWTQRCLTYNKNFATFIIYSHYLNEVFPVILVELHPILPFLYVAYQLFWRLIQNWLSIIMYFSIAASRKLKRTSSWRYPGTIMFCTHSKSLMHY